MSTLPPKPMHIDIRVAFDDLSETFQWEASWEGADGFRFAMPAEEVAREMGVNQEVVVELAMRGLATSGQVPESVAYEMWKKWIEVFLPRDPMTGERTPFRLPHIPSAGLPLHSRARYGWRPGPGGSVPAPARLVDDTRLTDSRAFFTSSDGRRFEVAPTNSNRPHYEFPETALPALARLRAEVEMCEDELQQSRLRAILDELECFAPEPDDLDQEDQPVATTPEPSSGVSSGS